MAGGHNVLPPADEPKTGEELLLNQHKRHLWVVHEQGIRSDNIDGEATRERGDDEATVATARPAVVRPVVLPQNIARAAVSVRERLGGKGKGKLGQSRCGGPADNDR